MRIWQAVWNMNGELLIWGEDTGSLAETPPAEDLDTEKLAIHPHALSFEQLREDFSAIEFEPDSERMITLTLPTDAEGPVPSFRFQKIQEIERTPTKLAEWNIPAFSLEPVPALGFLTSISEQLPAGLKLDDSVKYWLEATKLLLELLTRGRFLPSMGRRDGTFVARWHVVPTQDNDKKRIQTLARVMPPICRAYHEAEQQDSVEPSLLLESFITKCGDGLIRSFLRNHSLLPPEGTSQIKPRQQAVIAWLKALTRQTTEIDGPASELMKLEQALKRWAGPLVQSSEEHNLQTAFRLRTPEVPPADLTDSSLNQLTWIIDIMLQSTSDTSCQLRVSELWDGELGFLKQSGTSVDDLEEQLLGDLGRASSVFPELQQELEKPHPTRIVLDTTGAYRFLRETSVLLENMGFAIHLPSWWAKRTSKLGLHLRIDSNEVSTDHSLRPGFVGMQELVSFSWDIALGDRRISLDEFNALVERQQPLVHVGGEWVELKPEQLQGTIDFLRNQDQAEKVRLIEALRLGLGIEKEVRSLPVTGFSATGWVDRFLNAPSHAIEISEQPEDFEGSLRPYQLQGLSWLSFISNIGIGGCLADDMGLGKTIQLLALLALERQTAERSENIPRPKPTLLIVPMSILDNWALEGGRFTKQLSIYLHHGPQRLSGKAFDQQVAISDVVLTTYNVAYRDEQLFDAISWGRIALDEAQNIKNMQTKQTQAIRRITYRQLERSEATGSICQRLALTGTPLENHLEELWSIFDFLNPGFLGTIGEFRSRFTLPIERYRDAEAAKTLARLIQPFVLRRLKSDPKIISDLPEKIEMEVFTPLTDEQAALYQRIVNDMLPQVDTSSGMHRKGLVLATITKLKQICNHPVLFLKDGSGLKKRSGKLARLEQLLEVILAEKDKVLIFTQYAQMGKLLKPYLQERFDQEVLFLHGALPKNARHTLVERFQKPDGPSIFLLSLKAGGYGLNLTQANQVIHFDQWWNPAVEEQATDRAYRIGQTSNVQVRKFLCKGTLEERIATMLQSKRNLADSIVGATRNNITEMSTNDLQRLLQLSVEGDMMEEDAV